MELKNKKWSEERFLEERKKVLGQWKTGEDVNLEEAVEYLKSLPEHKNFAKRLIDAKRNNETLLQPHYEKFNFTYPFCLYRPNRLPAKCRYSKTNCRKILAVTKVW